MPADSLTGPWDPSKAAPFEAEPDLFAAPLCRTEPATGSGGPRQPGAQGHQDLIDPIPVTLRDGELMAGAGHSWVGAAMLARSADSESLV